MCDDAKFDIAIAIAIQCLRSFTYMVFFFLVHCWFFSFYVNEEMYEIAPYATFSVSCGRTTSELSKTPLRGVTPSALDYTVQFKTFGHPDGDNLNATAYPVFTKCWIWARKRQIQLATSTILQY